MKHRAVVIVLDGVGIGAMPDAERYGDMGADSLAHAAASVGGLRLPNLERLGLGAIAPIEGVRRIAAPQASFGRMAMRSPGKDSTSGHWELMGCPLAEPFPIYPDGFPPEIIDRFERESGTGVLGNVPASGTEIIELLGREHLRTGKPILYTSADSVFQLAAHEEVICTEELYELCRIAREMLKGPNAVGRVIARPFTGEPGSFVRTQGRKDFSLPPPSPTLLDRLSAAGFRVVTVGKIHNLFAGRGIDLVVDARSNGDAMTLAAEFVGEGGDFSLLFINLVDFDMLWGHRRDAGGYARGLEKFDSWIGPFTGSFEPGTLCFITSDHGCDPTMPGSDHTREYVPVLAFRAGASGGTPLGTRDSLSDVAATIAEHFGVEGIEGRSYLGSVPRG
jgi:phosphopentomutase